MDTSLPIELRNAANDMISYLQSDIIIRNEYHSSNDGSEFSVNNANGLSIHFPENPNYFDKGGISFYNNEQVETYKIRYEYSSFIDNNLWDNFLDMYFNQMIIPNITNVELNAQLVEPEQTVQFIDGEKISIRIYTKNEGLNAEWGSIHVSFPDISYASEGNIQIIDGDISNIHINDTGDIVGSDYGESTTIINYPFVEGDTDINPWNTGEEHFIEVEFTPPQTGNYEIFVKSVMYGSDEWVADPEKDSCEPSEQDQQSECVYKYTIQVVEPGNPELSFAPSTLNFGDKHEGITNSDSFDIWNSGTGLLSYDIIESCDWITINPTQGTSTGETDTITVTIDTTGLTTGLHSYDLTIDSNSETETLPVQVNIVEDTNEIIFYENWDTGIIDSSIWEKYGSPQSVIINSIFGQTTVFDNNGDSWCPSGVISEQSFTLTPPVTIESMMYVDLQDPAGCWASAGFKLSSSNQPLGENNNCPTTDYPWFLHIHMGYAGDACWATPEQYRRHGYLNFAFQTEDGDLDEGPSAGDGTIQRDDLIDGWHNYKVVINQDYTVSFIVDDEIIYTSIDKIDADLLNNCYLILGSRSSGSAGKTYHEYVKIYGGQGDDSDDNLVAYWSFNDNTDVGHDDSDNDHDATNNGATWNSNGISNGCLDFDGISDYLSIPDHQDLKLHQWSISSWVKIPEISHNTIVSKGEDTLTDRHNYNFYFYNDGANDKLWGGYECISHDDPGYTVSSDPLTGFHQSWHHVVFTRDTDNYLRLYIDGKLAGEEHHDQTPADANAPLYIGVRYDNWGAGFEHYFKGTMDEIKIYNRALSIQEIQTEFMSHAEIIKLTENSARDFDPAWSPDGSKIAFASTRTGDYELWVMDADGSNKQQLTSLSSYTLSPCWTPDGSKIVFYSNKDSTWGDIWVINADGSNPTRLTFTNGHAGKHGIDISPNGEKIVYRHQPSGTNWGYTYEIYTADIDCTGDASTVTIGSETKIASFDNNIDIAPVFSPDGNRIVWASGRNNPYGECATNCYFTTLELFQIDIDGTDETQLTFNTVTMDRDPTFSPDGTTVVFSSDRAIGSAQHPAQCDLWKMDADGSNIEQLIDLGGSEEEPKFSPDGTKILFSSDESGNDEIYVYSIAPSEEPIKKKALIIGCYDYDEFCEDLDIPVLAENLFDFFCMLSFGFDYDDIMTCLNPNWDELDENISLFLDPNHIKPDDKKFIYYVGHGSKFGNNEQLAPSDCSHYPDFKLANYLDTVKELGCIFDSCHSGGLCDSNDSSSDDVLSDNNQNGIIGTQKTILMAAESENLSTIDTGQGAVFSLHIIDAFTHCRSLTKNLISGDSDRVSLEESFIYAKNQIEKDNPYRIGFLEWIDVHPQIFDSYTDQFYLSDEPINDYWSIKGNCPIHLHAYDSDGNHVGYVNGGIENEIDGMIYCPIPENELIVFFKGNSNEDITIEIEAYGSGFFSLEGKDFNDNSKGSATKIYNSIPINPNSKASLVVNNGIFGDMSVDTNGDGNTDETVTPMVHSGSVFVPEASFESTQIEPFSVLEVEFDGTLSSDPDGDIVDYTWDFGDGTTGSGETITHQFSSTGTYDVILTVTDDDGLSTKTLGQVIVRGKPTGVPVFSPISLIILSVLISFGAIFEIKKKKLN